MSLSISGMYGLGDNIYQRPFIRAAAAREPVWLTTSWPELYRDLEGVRFARAQTRLRTQAKNIGRQSAACWSSPPSDARAIVLRYGAADFEAGSIVSAMEKQLPLAGATFSFDLPQFEASERLRRIPRPYAVVRPATLRREWLSPARNPRPEYLQQAIHALRADGLTVVTVADIESEEEWFDGPEPHGQDLRYHAGELNAQDLIALVRGAAVCVGGVGWIVPMAIAAGVPLFIVFGGRGGHNAPAKITDPRMDLRRIGTALPDRFCLCTAAAHDCDKRITAFEGRFAEWLERIRAW